MDDQEKFHAIVKGVKVLVRKYDKDSEDALHMEKLGIPLKCQSCGEEFEDEEDDEGTEIVHNEMVEMIVLVQQKVMVADNIISTDFVPYPYIVLYCRHCLEGIFKKPLKAEDLVYIQ